MDKRSEFNNALKAAMKNKDKVAISTVRLILAALKDRDISEREKGSAECVDDARILMMLQTMIKQRQESSNTYSEAGRDDLAEREEAEIDVIRSFMPKQLSEPEIEDAVSDIITKIDAKSIKDMGAVMAVIKADYAGKVDMGRVGAIAKKKLG